MIQWNNQIRHQLQSNGKPFLLIQYTHSGDGVWGESDGERLITPRTLMVMPVPSPTTYRMPKDGEWELSWFKFNALAAHTWARSFTERHGYLFDLPDSTPSISALLNALHSNLKGVLHPAHALEKLGHELIYTLENLVKKNEPLHPLEKAQQVILAHAHVCSFSIENVSDKSGMSRSHFTRSFKSYFGVSPKQYLTSLRLNMAKEELTSSFNSIKNIALSSGFQHNSHFIATFKREVGKTPLQYRQQFFNQSALSQIN